MVGGDILKWRWNAGKIGLGRRGGVCWFFGGFLVGRG